MSVSTNSDTNGHRAAGATALLEANDLHASYGPIEVLHGINFAVEHGEVVVILGSNGAGKTTTLRALCGMISARGSVRIEGDEMIGKPTPTIVRRGVAHVPQGRGTFPELSVEENLTVGAFVRNDGDIRADIDQWYEVFPVLGERRRQSAGSLSGGEQQMLAISRALMSRPKLLLLDEPSLGLAPLIVQGLFRRLGDLNKERGITMLVVEQNANLALQIAHRAYVLETGNIVLSGSAEEIQQDEGIRRAYLGY